MKSVNFEQQFNAHTAPILSTGSISLFVGESRNETAPGGQVNISAGDANSPLEAGAVNISAGNNHHKSGKRTLRAYDSTPSSPDLKNLLPLKASAARFFSVREGAPAALAPPSPRLRIQKEEMWSQSAVPLLTGAAATSLSSLALASTARAGRSVSYFAKQLGSHAPTWSADSHTHFFVLTP